MRLKLYILENRIRRSATLSEMILSIGFEKLIYHSIIPDVELSEQVI